LFLRLHVKPTQLGPIDRVSSSLAKQPFFEPQPSLQDSARLHSVFICLDFAAVVFLTEQGRQPCVQPGGLGSSIYAPQ
jgi:hypothetical protein